MSHTFLQYFKLTRLRICIRRPINRVVFHTGSLDCLFSRFEFQDSNLEPNTSSYTYAKQDQVTEEPISQVSITTELTDSSTSQSYPTASATTSISSNQNSLTGSSTTPTSSSLTTTPVSSSLTTTPVSSSLTTTPVSSSLTTTPVSSSLTTTVQTTTESTLTTDSTYSTTVTTTMTSPPPGCSSPFTEINNVGCLHFVLENVTFAIAKAACQQMNADLYVASTTEEFNSLRAFLKANYVGNDLWVGVKSRKWFGGRVPDWTEWKWGEPNDALDDCARMSGPGYRLHDRSCDFQYHYICQKASI
ncbi:integumentary mucin A.1-like [Palaemon carinicauda]|uniref:integumentary mucin A.1-like n=1 Tax=Palaemon carinicauda TaxID=392227 RepID=UPI0035B57EBB